MEPSPRAVRAVRHSEESAAEAREQGSPQYSAAVFFIRLPFDLPLGDGAQFSMRRSLDPEDPPWAEVTVRRVRINPIEAQMTPYESGLEVVLEEAEPDLELGSCSQTWAGVGVANVLFEDEPREVADEGFPSIAFERAVAAVNVLSESSRLVSGTTISWPLTKDSLDPTVTYIEVDLGTGEFATRRQLRLHHRHYNPVLTGYDPAEEHHRIASAVGARLASHAAAQPHPLLEGRALALQAHTLRDRGDAASALVVLQAATETTLRGIHRLLLVDAGGSAEAVAAEASCSFRSLVRTELPNLLKGRWWGPGAVPETYWHDLYGVRNQIVHAGRAPHWRQVNPAFDAQTALVDFLDVRITENWRSHPRTLVAWAEPWAGGTLNLKRAATAVASELRAEPTPYWLPADMAGR
jgi:hypothetical protein